MRTKWSRADGWWEAYWGPDDAYYLRRMRRSADGCAIEDGWYRVEELGADAPLFGPAREGDGELGDDAAPWAAVFRAGSGRGAPAVVVRARASACVRFGRVRRGLAVVPVRGVRARADLHA